MINKEQMRAARAWLSLSQENLATAAKVAKKTIADFERGATIPHDRTLRDLKRALEEMGVEFVFEGPKGVGVRVRSNETNRAAKAKAKT